MKKALLILLLFASTSRLFAQNNVGIGTTTPNGSAILDISSSTKGLLIPRMTTAERNAIATPATGLMVFDKTTNTFWFYNGNAWTEMSGSGSSPWISNGNDIYNINSGNTGIGTVSPAAKLDVLSSSAYAARFASTSNQMYIGFFENNTQRGYVGSYAGAAEDFDMGTSAINTSGKLHFTTMASPRMTITPPGNVGIGTTTPAEKLDINGSIKMSGELKPNGIAGTAGQVLTSGGNGTMQWSSLTTSSNSPGNGNGGWGDCSIYNIDAYFPAANEKGQATDLFGTEVSISGNYAIVGAPGDDENGLMNNGSATILKYNTVNSAWESQGKITMPNPAQDDFFGCSVSISGDYAIIGAYYDDELGLTNCGSATIYKRNASTGIWESQGKLLNPIPANNDEFGFAVSISGDYAMVSAHNDDEAGFSNCGSVTIFKRNAATGVWESQGKLLNFNPANGDNFGNAVSISGNYAIVGTPFDNEDGFTYNGSATIFKRNAATGLWENQGKITSFDPAGQEYFGYSVSINENYAAIGCQADDAFADGSGSVSIYKRNTVTGLWEFATKTYNPLAQASDGFGESVSVSDNYLMVGCSSDDENGVQNAGSVTIFKRVENIWVVHQKFNSPAAEKNCFFGNSVSFDPSQGRFIIGSEGTAMTSGMVLFGKVK